jgi:hypothetical protein
MADGMDTNDQAPAAVNTLNQSSCDVPIVKPGSGEVTDCQCVNLTGLDIYYYGQLDVCLWLAKNQGRLLPMHAKNDVPRPTVTRLSPFSNVEILQPDMGIEIEAMVPVFHDALHPDSPGFLPFQQAVAEASRHPSTLYCIIAQEDVALVLKDRDELLHRLPNIFVYTLPNTDADIKLMEMANGETGVGFRRFVTIVADKTFLDMEVVRQMEGLSISETTAAVEEPVGRQQDAVDTRDMPIEGQSGVYFVEMPDIPIPSETLAESVANGTGRLFEAPDHTLRYVTRG